MKIIKNRGNLLLHQELLKNNNAQNQIIIFTQGAFFFT